MIQGVLTHRPRHAATGGGGAGDIAAVADVPSATRLVWTDEVSADDLAGLLGDECLAIIPEPVCQRVGLAHIPIQRVRLASADRGLDDSPDRSSIAAVSGADVHC